MSTESPVPSDPPTKRFSPDDALPPVEPPSITFVLQLFLIPLLIVALIVMVWTLFSWMARMGSDPKELVREIRQRKDVSWQRAVTLANMLSSRDPRYDDIRRDSALAEDLASILREEMQTPLKSKKDDAARYHMRIYVSRALGEMSTPEGLPALLEEAITERTPVEVDTRLAALDSLALLASHWGPEKMRADEQAMKTLLECSRATDEGSPAAADPEKSVDYRPHGEIRAVSAYALGVVGGPEASERLVAMLDDAYASARYNAATGLARHGDARAIPVILEMLDPANELAAKDERYEDDQDNRRILVLKNGMTAAVQLAERNKDADLGKLSDALKTLTTAEYKAVKSARAHEGLRLNAREALRRMEEARR